MPAWEQGTEEERLVWCGTELLAVLREMFDDANLGVAFNFNQWVDRAPLTPKARRAIQLARSRDRREAVG